MCVEFQCSNQQFLNKNSFLIQYGHVTDCQQKLQKNCNTYFLVPKSVPYHTLTYGRFLQGTLYVKTRLLAIN